MQLSTARIAPGAVGPSGRPDAAARFAGGAAGFGPSPSSAIAPPRRHRRRLLFSPPLSAAAGASGPPSGEDAAGAAPAPPAPPPRDPRWLSPLEAWADAWTPPRWLWRSWTAVVLFGLTAKACCTLRVHRRNLVEQLDAVGPRTLGVALLTSAFVGMVFTIQFVREFAKLGLTRSVGGVLALALGRELTPVVTAIILAGRVGSAFAAELGTMQVSEQTDTLRVLGSDPVEYLVAPRVLSCALAMPVLNALCLATGLAASTLLADLVYSVPANVILDSAARALSGFDVWTSLAKSVVFGGVVASVSCAWGFTTTGGAKGVGESTTSAVVISLVLLR